MADDPKKKKADAKLVAGGEKYEVDYLKKQYPKKTLADIRAAIKKAGPSRAKIKTLLSDG